MIATKIWTTWNGSKIPVQLMEDEHIKSAYRRVREIIVATENNEWWKSHSHIQNTAPRHCSEKESPLTYEQALIFEKSFEQEAAKRKIKLPIITLQNYEQSFKAKELRKNWKREQNKKFDEHFK